MARALNGWLAVSWAPYSRRSEMFARELGGKLYCVHYLRFQSPPHAPIKYVLQACRTLQILFKERPEAIHVQSPPFVCGLVVDLYCRLAGAQFAIEHHSASFGRIWDWALPLQRLVARHAATNIVTSEHWAELVRSWDAHAMVMHDPFRDLPEAQPFPTTQGFKVAFVSTFAPDEPTEAVLGAATLLPDVHFYITGDTRKASPATLAKAPPNVTFTGFLRDRKYLGLLRAVDAIMVLTTRDHTLQLGGCEAMSVGKPLITSDWPYLREVFAEGTVFVASSADSIRDGVRETMERRAELAREIGSFRQVRQQQWDVRLAQLKDRVSSAGRARSGAGGRGVGMDEASMATSEHGARGRRRA